MVHTIRIFRIDLLFLCLVFTAQCFRSISVHAQGVGINTTGNAPHSSAGLDVSFSDKGLLMPRMTTLQRDAILFPEKGLQIYNTDCDNFNYNAGTSESPNWLPVNPPLNLPGAPGAISGSQSQLPFASNQVYSIDPLSGVTSYIWQVPSGWTITDGSGTNSITVSVGNAGQNGNVSVTTSNACSTGQTETLAVVVSWSCGYPLSVQHSAGDVAPVNKTVSYGTVQSSLSGASKCWITQNLGSTNQASSATDNTEAASGWYWQFNRKQGYQHDGIDRTPNTTWITSINESANWQSANDPCTLELGSGWRLPTQSEWNAVDGAPQNWASNVDSYNSILKIHSAGYINNSPPTMNARGGDGYYWASTQHTNSNGWTFAANSGGSFINSYNKWFGFSVRCLRD